MNKIEYIPGDLVKFATNTYTIVNFEENFLHNKICYALISTNSTKTAFVADRDILPIPITSEILEKNRWKKKMYCDWCHYLPIEGNILYLSKGIGIDGAFSVDVGQDMSYIASISFVHQLQHLFFGLGLKSEMEV